MTFAKEAARVLHARLLALGQDVVVATAAGTRRYHRGERLFCVVRPLAKRVDVGCGDSGRREDVPRHVRIHKMGRARSKRILHAAGHLPFVPYRVVVEAPGDVDRELLAWLQESYELAAEAGT